MSLFLILLSLLTFLTSLSLSLLSLHSFLAIHFVFIKEKISTKTRFNVNKKLIILSFHILIHSSEPVVNLKSQHLLVLTSDLHQTFHSTKSLTWFCKRWVHWCLIFSLATTKMQCWTKYISNNQLKIVHDYHTIHRALYYYSKPSRNFIIWPWSLKN